MRSLTPGLKDDLSVAHWHRGWIIVGHRNGEWNNRLDGRGQCKCHGFTFSVMMFAVNSSSAECIFEIDFRKASKAGNIHSPRKFLGFINCRLAMATQPLRRTEEVTRIFEKSSGMSLSLSRFCITLWTLCGRVQPWSYAVILQNELPIVSLLIWTTSHRWRMHSHQ